MKKLFAVILCIISLIISLHGVFTSSTYADGAYANLGTADAADAGVDAINFSQGYPLTIDKYGKYIVMTEDRSSIHHWTWSNNTGSSWTQGSETYQFLTRGSVAYDSKNDVLHVLWAAQGCDTSDGVIYRRYSITRDTSHNITSIQRIDTGVNLQVDTSPGSAVCEQPTALWVDDGSADGILVAEWAKYGMASGCEIRASMRKLDYTNNDGTAGNWVAITGSGSSFASDDPPAVSANKIYTQATGACAASIAVRGGTGVRKNDLYFFATGTGSSSHIYAYRTSWNSTNKDWSGGLQAAVDMGSVNNDAGGYNLKYQLISKPTLDTTNDRLYVGWSRWKDNTAGDTASMAYLDSVDSPSSVFDMYSANGAHSYAPTFDIIFAPTDGSVYAFYVESTTNGTNGSTDYKIFNGSTFSSSTRFYTNATGSGGADGGTDEPGLLFDTNTNTILNIFRVNGAIPPTAINPHKIDFGFVTVVAPTATPTPTNTPVPTATPTPTSQPVAPQSPAMSASPPSPNTHAGWQYTVTAGPSFVGTPQFIFGSGDAANAGIFVGRSANHDDVYLDITRVSVTDMLYRPHVIPFPWMQGFNTASEVYSYMPYTAFNGVPIASFENPVTVILRYDPLRAYWILPSRFRIGWYDPLARRWKVVSNKPVINRQTYMIAEVTRKIGYFAVIYPR